MKLLRVDMTRLEICYDEAFSLLSHLGGRGFTSCLVNQEVPGDCDPLGPENKLVFAPGLLSGTNVVNNSRISIGAKSPLTGGIKESNVGGTVSNALVRTGIGAIVVEGASPTETTNVLTIDKYGKATLIAAQELKGLTTYEAAKSLRAQHGGNGSVLCVGPAGDYAMPIASIQSTDTEGRPCRAAGRGGLGAVMGMKGLKAIVVEHGGKESVPISDSERFKKAASTYAKILREHPFTSKAMPAIGTAMMVAPINLAGAFPCFNATKGVFPSWEAICGEKLADTIAERGGKVGHRGCSQCVIRCSNEFVDAAGEFVTASLEYETIWAVGAMCGIGDLDAIAALDFLCDNIGVDTMSAGVAIAVAMDAGYRPFGDSVAALDLIRAIGRGDEIGRIIGAGPQAVGKHYGHHRVPVCKGQSIAAYDPRAIQGMAVTYATSPMGADHTAGWVVGDNLAAMGGNLDPLSAEGQSEASRRSQISSAAFDCTGLCLFANSPAATMPEHQEAMFAMIGSRLGVPFTEKDFLELGVRVLKTEREFNQKAGFTSADDRMAGFFYEEPLPPHNTTVVIPDEDMDRTLNF